MPIYEYEPRDEPCKICRGKFTLNRPLSAPPIERCPLCKKPVRKILSNFHTPALTKPPSVSDAKPAGFRVCKKTSAGEYERQ
jgi:putative FmdB family regulatory protein